MLPENNNYLRRILEQKSRRGPDRDEPCVPTWDLNHPIISSVDSFPLPVISVHVSVRLSKYRLVWWGSGRYFAEIFRHFEILVFIACLSDEGGYANTVPISIEYLKYNKMVSTFVVSKGDFQKWV